MPGRDGTKDSLTTLNDFKLLQLAWLYDLNFACSLRMVVERDYILHAGGYAASDRGDRTGGRTGFVAYVTAKAARRMTFSRLLVVHTIIHFTRIALYFGNIAIRVTLLKFFAR